MKNESIDKFEDETAVLGRGAHGTHELYTEDGSNDISDDVMKEEAVVGDQERCKGHQV